MEGAPSDCLQQQGHSPPVQEGVSSSDLVQQQQQDEGQQLQQQQQGEDGLVQQTLLQLQPLQAVLDQQQQPQEAHSSVFCVAGDPCSVCHDEFVSGCEVLQLPCRHCFHEHCLAPWLMEVRGSSI